MDFRYMCHIYLLIISVLLNDFVVFFANCICLEDDLLIFANILFV